VAIFRGESQGFNTKLPCKAQYLVETLQIAGLYHHKSFIINILRIKYLAVPISMPCCKSGHTRVLDRPLGCIAELVLGR